MPPVPAAKLVEVFLAGATIALVGLAEGLSAGRLFAVKGGYRIDTNQELIAAGAGNAASGLFGGLGVAGSLSKTAAVDRAGGTSQVSGLSAAALAIAVIAFLAPALSALPLAVLSAIVIHAVWGLMDLAAIRRYLRVRRNDFVAALVAAAGVLLAGPLLGLIVAVAQSLLGLVYRSSRVDVEVLGKIHGEKAAWGGIRNHPERTTVAGVLVLRLDSSLFWVNAAAVRDAILEAVDAAAELEAPKALVLDLESTDQLETTSADMLFALRDELAERGVDLYLVRVRWPVRRLLARSGLREAIGEDHLWHNVAQGVREARRQHQLGGHRHPEPNVTNGPEAVIVTPTRPDDKQDGDARTEPG